MFDTTYNQRRVLERELEKSNSSLPYRFVFVLTNMCNLRCSFCFQEKKYNKSSLNLHEWKDVIDQIPPGSHITLTGGEPLMFRGFKELISSFRNDITFNVITNGLLLDEITTNFLLNQSGLRVLSCSCKELVLGRRPVPKSDGNSARKVSFS